MHKKHRRVWWQKGSHHNPECNVLILEMRGGGREKWKLSTNRIGSEFLRTGNGGLNERWGSIVVKVRIKIVEKMTSSWKIFGSRSDELGGIADVTWESLSSRVEQIPLHPFWEDCYIYPLLENVPIVIIHYMKIHFFFKCPRITYFTCSICWYQNKYII
jgi:hypothetical protein